MWQTHGNDALSLKSSPSVFPNEVFGIWKLSIVGIDCCFSLFIRPDGPPGRAPFGRCPALAEIDRLASNLVATEFQNATAIVPRPAVIADGVLGHPEITPAANTPDLEFEVGWVDLPPSDKV